MPACQKPCLLTLKLSSPSFLDSVVGDDQGTPGLYAISTTGATTRITRADPWDGPTDITTIKWPPTNQKSRSKNWDGLLVQIRNGDWEPGENVLRQGSVLSSSPRKFTIPGYSKSLKWKAVGSQYWCLSPSVEGPIATLDPAVGSVPPRLKIYESLHDKYDSRPMLVHHGVSLLLLDYLVITALLLVTEIKDIRRYEHSDGHAPLTGPSFLSINASTIPWSKLSPDSIFRRRSQARTSADNLPSSSTSSVGQIAKIVYGDPIYPTLSPVTPDSSSADSDSERDNESDNEDALSDGGLEGTDSAIRMPSSSRPPSPSHESICYPLRNTSAPSHTYIDPSFYADPHAPPVPPIPSEHSSSSPTSHHGRSIPRVSSIASFRKLPSPPSHTLARRPQSSPADGTRRSRSTSLSSSRLSSPVSPHCDGSPRRLPAPPRLRTLPQTPPPLAPRHKDSHDDLSGWLLMGTPHVTSSGSRRLTIMDMPPPAYSSIDFALPEDVPPPTPISRPLPSAPSPRPVPTSL